MKAHHAERDTVAMTVTFQDAIEAALMETDPNGVVYLAAPTLAKAVLDMPEMQAIRAWMEAMGRTFLFDELVAIPPMPRPVSTWLDFGPDDDGDLP